MTRALQAKHEGEALVIVFFSLFVNLIGDWVQEMVSDSSIFQS